MAQSVAHLIGSEEVTGSIPVASFLKTLILQGKMDVKKKKPPRKGGLFLRLTTIET